MLQAYCIEGVLEAGCDEAGRGPLAGSVFAAAVVFDSSIVEDQPHREWLEMLNDSKQLTDKQRQYLRPKIEQYATAWAVVEVTAEEIDEINILKASIVGMQRALDKLGVRNSILGCHAIFSVPCGSGAEIINKYRKIAKNCSMLPSTTKI